MRKTAGASQRETLLLGRTTRCQVWRSGDFELLEVLSLYVPPDWQHGEQWAPEELKEGMRLHNVFAKRVRAKFERRLTVFGVPSFVTMWRTKHDANV
ncbi:hypothetical protein ACVWZR_002350 [Bradyrhizobium sp. i1.3.1]